MRRGLAKRVEPTASRQQSLVSGAGSEHDASANQKTVNNELKKFACGELARSRAIAFSSTLVSFPNAATRSALISSQGSIQVNTGLVCSVGPSHGMLGPALTVRRSLPGI